MKNPVPVVCAMLLLFASCQDNNAPAREEHTAGPPTATRPATPGTPLAGLREFDGQYPADVHLLDMPALETRLKNLLGPDYADFRKYWQTETPIVLEGNVISATGCEQHNCGANQYILQVDLQTDNINVYHLGAASRSYLEKGAIRLPQGLAKDFETTRDNIPQ